MALSIESFEELIDLQTSIGNDIIKCYTNYKKLSSSERIKLTVVCDKINKVCALFKKFEENDYTIKLQGFYEQHEYFSNQYFEKIKKLHEDSLPLLTPSKEFQNNKESGNKEAEEVKRDQFELTRLIKLQRSAFSIFTNKLNKVNGMDMKTMEVTSLEFTIEQMMCQWDKILDTNRRIFSIAGGFEEQLPFGYTISDYNTLEDDFEAVMARLLSAKRKASLAEVIQQNPMQNSSEDNINRYFHLPKVNIPKFDGNVLQWNSFKNLFIEMIEKSPISNAQKLFYLKSNLTGEAASLVTIMDINVDTYDDAWKRLSTKYDNERVLTCALAEKLFSQQSLKEESATGLRSLREVTKECITSPNT